jgi:hypothetical protein
MVIEETGNLSWHKFDFPCAVSSHAERHVLIKY